MENSAQVGEEQFDEIKDFAKQFVAAFDVREGGTHVAVVSYGSRPVVDVRLNSYSGPVLNTRTITDDIDEIAFRSVSPVSTSSALTEVINTVYGDGNGARNGTNKVTDNLFFFLYIRLSWKRYITLKVSSLCRHLGVEIGACLFRLTYAPFPLRRRNVKTQQSPLILDLYLCKTSILEITWLS